MTDDNIFRFGTVQGGKQEAEDKDEFPAYPYVITDIDDEEYLYEGYLIFTSHHVCVMEDSPKGPVTGFMIPMIRVKNVALLDEDEETVN